MVLSLALCAVVYRTGWSQTNQLSGPLVLRSQAGKLAEEIVGRIGQSFPGGEQVGLHVDGGVARALIENAFIEMLGRRGIRANVQPSVVVKRTLDVQVLEQTTRYQALSSGEYRREIRTSVEVRTSFADSAFTSYVGSFQQADTDTVAFREEGMAVLGARDAERTTLDRLLGPVLLIGGVFLVVYLFFTVRN